MTRSRWLVGGALAGAVVVACSRDYAAAPDAPDAAADADASSSPDVLLPADATSDTASEAGTDASEAGPFDANFYGNLELWLAADYGVNPSDGGGITAWTDRSLHKRAVTAPLDATCQQGPTLVPSAIHGLPVLHFNGGTQCLTVDGAFVSFASGLTVFAVFQPETCNSAFLGSASALFDSSKGVAGGSYTEGITVGRNPTPAQNASGDAYLLVTNGGGTGSVSITGGGSWAPVTAELLELRLPAAPGGALVAGTAYVNGATTAPNPNNPFVPDFESARTRTYVGYNANPVSGYPLYCGGIGELLVYSKALSDADRVAVESHLRARWGL